MTRQIKWIGMTLAAIVASVGLFSPIGCSVVGIRTVEEAGYSVVSEAGNIELRQYDELVVAETTVDADYDEAGRVAFRRLFRYISGDNVSDTSIAMTAPVMAEEPEQAEGEQIAMTTPILGERSSGGWRYAFVLPSDYAVDDAPAPSNPDVSLSLVPSKQVAVIRYSGSWNEEAMRQKSDELVAWVEANGLEALSSPRSAGYDPPWTLPFLRRNEVMIDVR